MPRKTPNDMSSLIRGLHSSVYARERVENCIILTVYTDTGMKDLQFNPLYMKVNGSYTVDWGDGTVNSESAHTYSLIKQTYTVRIRGNIYEIEGGVGGTSSAYVYWIPMLQTSVMIKKVSFNSPCNIRIGRHAVIGSPSGRIEEVTFGDNVVSVGFSGTGNLEDRLFSVAPEKIRFLSRKCVLNNYAFSFDTYSPNITYIDIPDGCTEIPYMCFYGAQSYKIDIPEGVISLGTGSFYRNQTATTVTLPSSLTTASQAFQACNSVTNAYCYAATPPAISVYDFGSHPTIHVRAASLSTYQSSTWNSIGTLVGDL